MPAKPRAAPLLSAPLAFGITRIDQTAKKSHGFYVRIAPYRPKFFSDGKWGKRKTALEAAQNYRDSLWDKLPLSRQQAALNRKPRKLNRPSAGTQWGQVTPAEA